MKLGIDVNSADMCWSLFTIITNGNKEIKQVLLPTTYKKITKQSAPDFIERFPAWSLTALMGLIPNSINFVYENDSIFVLKKIENDNYIADYYEVSFVKDNPLDTVFEMIVWLKENGKI